MVSLTAGLHEDALHHSVRILPPNLVILIKLLQNILHTLQSRIFIAFEHKVFALQPLMPLKTKIFSNMKEQRGPNHQTPLPDKKTSWVTQVLWLFFQKKCIK